MINLNVFFRTLIIFLKPISLGLIFAMQIRVTYASEWCEELNDTCFLHTILSGDSDYCKALLAKNQNLSFLYNGMTVLHWAALSGNDNIVRELLQRDVPIDAQDFFGNTALMLALKKGHVVIADYLLKANADTRG